MMSDPPGQVALLRPMIEDWMSMFESENSAPCTAAGRPSRRMSRSSSRWKRSRLNDRRHQLCSLVRRMASSTADAALEMLVAAATPSTDMSNASTNSRFSPTLSRPVNVRMYSGVRVSPLARRMAIMKLAAAMNGTPRK